MFVLKNFTTTTTKNSGGGGGGGGVCSGILCYIVGGGGDGVCVFRNSCVMLGRGRLSKSWRLGGRDRVCKWPVHTVNLHSKPTK